MDHRRLAGFAGGIFPARAAKDLPALEPHPRHPHRTARPEVLISLSKLTPQGEWELLDEKTTDGNGRVKDFLEQDGSDHAGVYKLTYHVGPYFEKQGQNSFYPFIEVVFQISGSSHYHVPITLSPYGYSTYRGN